MPKICIVDGCDIILGPHDARGMCQKHYQRWRHTGKTNTSFYIQDGHCTAHKKEYSSWSHMKDRTLNKNHVHYNDYGGRGIKICERWLEKPNGFQNFLEDMGKCPDGCTLDRIDVDGNYTPENCRWATHAEQSCNRRNNNRIPGVRYCKFHKAWCATIYYNGKNMTRYFKNKKDAVSQRMAWENIIRGKISGEDLSGCQACREDKNETYPSA